MHGADTGTGLHGHHRLGNHRHVNDDTVTAHHAERLQTIGQTTDLGMQLPVAQALHVTRLALEDYRRLMATARQVYVEAIPGDVQLPVRKPLVIWRPGIIQGDCEGFMPVQGFAGQIAPEADMVGSGAPAQFCHFCGAQARTRCKSRWRRKSAALMQGGFDILLFHSSPPASV